MAFTTRAQPEKLALLEQILERAADDLGDIAPLVLERFFTRHPEAKALFDHQGGSYSAQLQAEMVESGTYCLLAWYERPAEIEILYGSTVPHHQYLKIPIELFIGLQEAVLDVVASVVKPDESELADVLDDVRNHLTAAIISAGDIR